MNQFLSARNRMRTHEAGASLVENIIAVVILGICGPAILGAAFSHIRASDGLRQATEVRAALVRAAENVADQTTNPYVACAVPATYTVGSAPSGITVTITSVEYFSGTLSASVTGSEFSTTCPSPAPAAGDARRVQSVILSAITADGRSGTKTLQVIKREG